MEVLPTKARVRISAGALFKPRSHEPKRRPNANRVVIPAAGGNVSGSPIKGLREVKSQFSSHSPLKRSVVRKRKRGNSDKHPLTVEFSETATSYRAYLYNTTTAKINATHTALLKALHNANVQTVSPTESNVSNASSPLKFTLGMRIKRETGHMYTPIGPSLLTFHSNNKETGEEEQINITLGERISRFEMHVKTEQERIMSQQRQWEAIINEIWKCGEWILGAEVMSELLTRHTTTDDASPQPQVQDEDTLFIPGKVRDGAEPQSIGDPLMLKKRVSFKDPIPAFLAKPAKLKKLAPLPYLPVQEVEETENRIKGLGDEQTAELKTLYKKQEKLHAKRKAQLIATFQQDMEE